MGPRPFFSRPISRPIPFLSRPRSRRDHEWARPRPRPRPFPSRPRPKLRHQKQVSRRSRNETLSRDVTSLIIYAILAINHFNVAKQHLQAQETNQLTKRCVKRCSSLFESNATIASVYDPGQTSTSDNSYV